jgi:DNA-binding response OmpR family regulator
MEPYRTRILICDDNDDIRDILESFLTSQRYDVYSAANYDEAVKLLQDHSPDVALLDIRMPDVDGFCVAERIRFHNAKLPIIFISAFESRFARIYAQTIEAHAFLQKPIDFALLKETIEWAIQNPLPKSTVFHAPAGTSSSAMLASATDESASKPQQKS